MEMERLRRDIQCFTNFHSHLPSTSITISHNESNTSDGHNAYSTTAMAYFRITLLRSCIGLPRKTSGVLHALGLKKRMTTVYMPVSKDVAGQIFAVKELVDVQEVESPLTREEMKELRRPERGFYVETRAKDIRETL